MAPLSIVQIVLAGGVVLLAIMAERVLGVADRPQQWIGLACTAGGLMLLGVSLPAAHGAHSQFSVPGMIAFEAMLIVAGTLLIIGPRIGAPDEHHGFMLGAAAGILFGVSDVAIKAMSGMVGAHGVLGLISPWRLICVAASVAAFYASAKGLQDGDAVPVIAVTGTAANVSGDHRRDHRVRRSAVRPTRCARHRVLRVRAGDRGGLADAGAGSRRACCCRLAVLAVSRAARAAKTAQSATPSSRLGRIRR